MLQPNGCPASGTNPFIGQQASPLQPGPQHQQPHPPAAGYNAVPPPFSSQQQPPQQQYPQAFAQQQPPPPTHYTYPPQQQSHFGSAAPASIQSSDPYTTPSLQRGHPIGSTNQIDKATVPHGWALAEYGSPFAHFKDWRATAADQQLTSFPDQKLMLRIKQRFARSPGDVWAHQGRSFSRPPQQGWDSAPFQPFSLPSAGEQLADGFKPLYPGNILADHDVSAADWNRFLEDITVAGRMTGVQQVVSNFAPVTMHLGATGFLVTKALQKRMKRGKEPAVTETVEMWEQNFFLRRGIDVYIRDSEGRMTALAPGEPLPVSNHPTPTELQDNQHSDSSSSDDSSDEDAHQMKSRKERKNERKERRREHKQDKRKKKEEKKKDKKKSRFYLIFAPYHPQAQ